MASSCRRFRPHRLCSVRAAEVNIHLANLVLDVIIAGLWCAGMGVLVWKGTRRFVTPDVWRPWDDDEDD